MIDSPQKDRALTIRSLLLGILIVILVNIGSSYSLFILHSTLISVGYLPLVVVFLFFLVVAILNIVIKSLCPCWALRPPELAIIFVMALLGATFQPFGSVSLLIGIIGAPYYFASPENQWAQYLFGNIPNWIAPNRIQAIRWFWEGLPDGQGIPWGAWIIPLIWWFSFIGAFFFVCFCVVTILNKQWVEKERIPFPLAQVPVEMIREADGKAIFPTFMRSRLFWIGFSIPFFIVVWNIGHYFSPFFPVIPAIGGSHISIGRDFPEISVGLSFHLIGFAYFANLDVLASIWFFYLLSVLQIGISNKLGFSIGSSEVFCSENPSIGWQGFGAMIVIVAWGIWTARSHLRNVFRKAFGKEVAVDDSQEMLSYRTAVFGLVLGLVFMFGWLHKSGMGHREIFLFLGAVFVVLIGLTIVVSQGGLVKLRTPLIPPIFTVYTLGSSTILPPSITALAFSYAWIADLDANIMTAIAQCGKLGSMIKVHMRSVFKAAVIAILVSAVVFVWYSLYLGYRYGAFNQGGFIFGGGPQVPFDSAVAKMKNIFGPDWKRLSFLGIGGIAGVGLNYMRYRFIWWPLSPLGFAVASVLPVRGSAFSIFLAWAIKGFILRFGGVKTYRRARPFFIGLVIGLFVGVGISFLVDMIWFPGHGHAISGM